MRRPRLGGAVYVLPNLLTTGNLFWGFFSIIKSLQGEFGWAASAILLAAVFDMLDGRVARLTKGTSEFGVQYDSLCDLVSFGCAPAFMMYQYALQGFGRLGWIFCFLFLACGALRLARFNVQSSIGKASGDFTGLPIPMAAAVIATFVAFVADVDATPVANAGWFTARMKEFFTPDLRSYFLLAAAPLLALAMVSNLVYRSHKALRISGIKPFKLLAGAVFGVALLAYKPEAVGFAFCLLYALSGPFEWIVGWKKPIEEDEIFETSTDQTLEDDASAIGEGNASGGSGEPTPINRLSRRDPT